MSGQTCAVQHMCNHGVDVAWPRDMLDSGRQLRQGTHTDTGRRRASPWPRAVAPWVLATKVEPVITAGSVALGDLCGGNDCDSQSSVQYQIKCGLLTLFLSPCHLLSRNYYQHSLAQRP